MKVVSLFLLVCLVLSCTTITGVEKRILEGNYTEAIQKTVRHIQQSARAANNDDYILLLEEAFRKASVRDQEQIKYLELNNSLANAKKVYTLYTKLSDRQGLIESLLPLTIKKENRKAYFELYNYTIKAEGARKNVADLLFSEAKRLLSLKDKFQARKAYDYLQSLQKIAPNHCSSTTYYRDKARKMGMDFILVRLSNETNQIIPRNLERVLLDMDVHKLNKKWQIFHNKTDYNTRYDYVIEMALRRIIVSPERIDREVFNEEKQVPDGWVYLYRDGKVVLDKDNNKIKIDKFRTIRGRVIEFHQFKSCNVEALIRIVDAESHRIIDKEVIKSEFVFEHNYATYTGERGVFHSRHLDLFAVHALPFPSDEQMVFDTNEDLKKKFRSFISRMRL